ncbi:hypothetical protein V6N12_037665 [Hibiscus sabdariffa]|uniref:Uncharacterized protein n=1 Tax=Hibiscus sabdariffa TaxID=183260 RepID=A0ABR2C1Z0_9ROSI
MTLEPTTDVMVRESESSVVVENNWVEKSVPEKMSYAALVAGIGKSTNSGVPSASDFDVVVEEADYVVRRDGVYPSIRFSERVHERIDYGMRQAVIVRLLGRNIGYKTLFSRLKRSRPDKQDTGVDMADKTCVGGERSATYGPWMIVTHRRGNYQRAPNVVRNKQTSGSRFSVLDGGDDEVVPIEVENTFVTERGKADQVGHGSGSGREGNPGNAVGTATIDEMLNAEPDSLLEVENTFVTERGKADQAGHGRCGDQEGNPDNAVGNAAVDETLNVEPDTLLEVVGGGSKVPVVLLNGSQEMRTEHVQVLPKISRSAKGTHTCIVIRDKENMGPDGSDTGRKSGGLIRTMKIAPKRGITLRKHGQNNGGSTSVLSEWIPAAVANIDRVAQEVVQHKSDSSLSLGAESGSNYPDRAGILEGSVDVEAPLGGSNQFDQRRHNMVLQFLDDDGSVCVDQSVLARMARDYFQKLFSSSGSVMDSYQTRGMFPGISFSVFQELGRPLLNDEVKVKFWTDEWLGDIGPLANHVVSREWLGSKDFVV